MSTMEVEAIYFSPFYFHIPAAQAFTNEYLKEVAQPLELAKGASCLSPKPSYFKNLTQIQALKRVLNLTRQ